MLYKETWRKDYWFLFLHMFSCLVSIHSEMGIQQQTSCLHQRSIFLAWFWCYGGWVLFVRQIFVSPNSEFEQHMYSTDPRYGTFLGSKSSDTFYMANYNNPYNLGRMEKPESGTRNRSPKRKRKWNLKPKPNLNLRNKTWRRFCLKSVTNNYCSIKTFHSHIIFIYCYYIFYCRIFCVRRKIFLREFHIRVSVATWDHDWHEYSSSLCRLFLTMDETRSPFKKWVT